VSKVVKLPSEGPNAQQASQLMYCILTSFLCISGVEYNISLTLLELVSSLAKIYDQIWAFSAVLWAFRHHHVSFSFF